MSKWIAMRLISLVAILTTSLSWADDQRLRQQLAEQLPVLWQHYRPVCVMALAPELQLRVDNRLLILDEQLVPGVLNQSLDSVGAPVLTSVWKNPAWRRMALLEQQALQPEEREELREYYFKLQVNKPNAARKDLITELQQTAHQLNLALREGIWKTCYALGMEGVAAEQMEAALDNRWQKQREKIDRHLDKELSAFFFYSYRQITNEELQQFAQLQLDVLPWTEAMVSGIQQHFAFLRQQLILQPLADAPTTAPADAPFPADRPWTQAPSQSPFQP